MGIQIAPSILAADFANLETEIAAVADADWLHVDVMDGHFVPNMTLGLPVFERVAQVSPLPVDAHLMIDDPDMWAPRYAEAGANSVTFHMEAAAAPVRIARDLRKLGVRAGIAIKPGTPVEPLFEFLPEFDMILIMTVEPGFGGQVLLESTLPKLRALRAAATAAGSEVWIQADGGIARDTIERVVDAGADMLVLGSAVYSAENRRAEIAALRALSTRGHHG
jgi:ribulose-phosphate 3-epimerase